MPASSLFGKLLREFRERAELSQPTLAAYLNVSSSTISRLEAGRKKPPEDSAFYEQLGAVTGFTKADVTLLLEAAESSRFTEDLENLSKEYRLAHIFTHHAFREVLSTYGAHLLELPSGHLLQKLVEAITMYTELALRELTQPSTQAPQAFPTTGEEAPEILTESSHADDLIRLWTSEKGANPVQTLVKPEGDPLPHVEKELQPSSQSEQRGRVRKKDIVSQRTRTHYDSEYLQENPEHVMGLVFEAATSNDPDLSPAAEQVLQSIHVVAESVVKRKGTSLSRVSREHHIPLTTLSRWVTLGLVRVLYKDKKTTYLAQETAQELGRDKQDAEEMEITLPQLLRERHEKYFPEVKHRSVPYPHENVVFHVA
jgi:transcriptional regulator with XRE-family HTH domain